MPASAAGALRPPGPPVLVTLEVTSGVGLFVNWEPPSANTGSCGYGGDGGSDISEYVVEWDVNAYFDSPAERISLPSSQTAFLIGGRDPMTGVESTILERGTRYDAPPDQTTPNKLCASGTGSECQHLTPRVHRLQRLQ